MTSTSATSDHSFLSRSRNWDPHTGRTDSPALSRHPGSSIHLSCFGCLCLPHSSETPTSKHPVKAPAGLERRRLAGCHGGVPPSIPSWNSAARSSLPLARQWSGGRPRPPGTLRARLGTRVAQRGQPIARHVNAGNPQRDLSVPFRGDTHLLVQQIFLPHLLKLLHRLPPTFRHPARILPRCQRIIGRLVHQ